jgi:two-component system response regulator HydG
MISSAFAMPTSSDSFIRAHLAYLDSVVAQAAGADTGVLITGERGTGAEDVARLIHARSRRTERSCAHVHCEDVPEPLLERALFGEPESAGLRARSALEIASGGTVFLDEVGALSARLQARVARELQDIDARLIAFTSHPAPSGSDRGGLCPELRDHLSTRLDLKPLRERSGDVIALAQTYLEAFCREFRLPAPGLTFKAVEWLRAGAWTGNERELRNVIERAVVRARAGRIGVRDLQGTRVALNG